MKIFYLFFIFKFFTHNVKFNWTNYHTAVRHMWKMIIPYFLKFDFEVWIKDDMLHILPRLESRQIVDVSCALKKFFNYFAKWCDGLIYIGLPYEDINARFDRHSENRPQNRKANRAEIYERAYAQIMLLKDVLLKQTTIPVFVLDGNSDLDDKSF